MISECLKLRNKGSFVHPLDNDTLSVLLDTHTSSVDLYSDLEAKEGAGVEGMTEFRKGHKPKISIDKRLSENPAMINRLRSTMAHELFHARFHLPLWELYWLGKSKRSGCHHNEIIISGKTDWYEWQAAYGSGAILMPRSAIMAAAGSEKQIPDVSAEGMALIEKISAQFQTSRDAARVRLSQLSVLKQASRMSFSSTKA